MYLKKFIFILLFSCLFICPCKAITPTVEYQDNLYSNRSDGAKTYSGQMGFLVIEDKVVFCLDPYKVVGDNYEIDNTNFNSYKEEDLEYIKLVSIYVDKYIQQRNIYYYMAAQELIWERLYGNGTVHFTTEKDGNGELVDLMTFKSEIEQYVNNFLTKPSFDGTIIKDNFYTTIILEDTNEVLSEYEIINDSTNNIWKSDNNLYIKILSSKLSNIKLIRKIGSDDPIYYYSSANQDLAYLNSSIEIISEISVQANNKYNENVVINFYDKEIKGLISEAVKFEIIDIDNSEVIVDTESYNGMYYTNLTAGNYEFRVENVSDKYLIPESRFFSIIEENPYVNRSIIINFDRPIGRLNVNVYQEGSYELYFKNKDTNDLIDIFDVTKSFDLNLGSYYVIDISNSEKYEVDLEYKDALTSIIVYNLDIYPDKIDIEDAQGNLNGDNDLTDKNDETNDDSSLNDKENNWSNDENYNKKDEPFVDEQDKNNSDTSLNDDIVWDEEKESGEQANNGINDNNSVNNSDNWDANIEIDVSLDNESNSNQENKPLEEDNNLTDSSNSDDKQSQEDDKTEVEKEQIKIDIPPLNAEDIVTEKDISNIENLQTLPNTSNYMKTLKSYLLIFLISGLIFKFKN